MKSLAITLVLVGLITGPGYLIYSYHFSGSLLTESTVYSSDVIKFSSGAVQASSSSNAKWTLPVELLLTPEMNPISISTSIINPAP